jgi:hypothetical protein
VPTPGAVEGGRAGTAGDVVTTAAAGASTGTGTLARCAGAPPLHAASSPHATAPAHLDAFPTPHDLPPTKDEMVERSRF